MRDAYQVGAWACLRAAAFDLALTGSSGGDAMEQRREQVLDATRTEFPQRHLDRPPAAQHDVGRGQERPRVGAVPHRLCGGNHARQALRPLAFLGFPP